MENQGSLVSIIIPCYNCGRYLRQCLESVLQQTYQNIEVIAVNDGSKDKTPEILAQMASTDARLVVINKKNGGVSSARNAGLDAAQGTYIAFVDADDTLSPTAIQDLTAAMDEQTDMVIGSNREYWFYKKDFVKEPCRLSTEEIREKFAPFNVLIKTVWKILYRRSVIEENGIRFHGEMHFGEDYHFNLTYVKDIRRGARIISSMVYNYYNYRSAAHKKYFPHLNEFFINIFDAVFAYYGSEPIPFDARKYFINANLDLMTRYYLMNADANERSLRIGRTYAIIKEYFSTEEIRPCLPEERFLALEENRTEDYIRLCYPHFHLWLLKNKLWNFMLIMKKKIIR